MYSLDIEQLLISIQCFQHLFYCKLDGIKTNQISQKTRYLGHLKTKYLT